MMAESSLQKSLETLVPQVVHGLHALSIAPRESASQAAVIAALEGILAVGPLPAGDDEGAPDALSQIEAVRGGGHYRDSCGWEVFYSVWAERWQLWAAAVRSGA